MKILDVEIPEDLLAEYVELIHHMYDANCKGVSLSMYDGKRVEIHEKILTLSGKDRYSELNKALEKYVENIRIKENWGGNTPQRKLKPLGFDEDE